MTINLPTGLAYVERILALGEDYLSSETRQAAHEILERARRRGLAGTERTVVAFAGATGSGKSSLLNAIVNQDVAKTSAHRPATENPQAVTGRHATDILDWLGIDHREVLLQMSTESMQDLVLIDLPDVDSTMIEHHERAADIISRADVLLWVLDPQKYADAVIHEDYLSELKEHEANILVVLNQIDRIPSEERDAVVNHVRHLLSLDGIRCDVTVSSTVTGEGVEEIRGALAYVSSKKRASAQRLVADLRKLGGRIAEEMYENSGVSLEGESQDTLVDDLCEAATGKRIARRAGDKRARQAHRQVRWSLWRFPGSKKGARSLEENAVREPGAPLKALVEARLGTSSAPHANKMPRLWRLTLHKSSSARVDDISRDIQEAVVRAGEVEQHIPVSWRICGWLQWLSTKCILLGFIWWIVDVIVQSTGGSFPSFEPIFAFPVPLLITVISLVISGLCLVWGSSMVNSARHRGRFDAQKRMEEAVAKIVDESLLTLIQRQQDKYDEFCSAVSQLSEVVVR